MKTESVLTDDSIFALAAETDIASIDPKVDVLMFSRDEMLQAARAIEQAVLQSPEIQVLRQDLGMMRAAVRILSSAVELFAGELGADLGESKVSVTTNGDELAAVSIRDVIHKARAAMEKQP